MARYDTIITNGTVVTPETRADLDVAIADGQIAALGRPGDLDAADREIDASGNFVMPGFVDAHVHVKIPLGEFTTLDNFEGVTRGAAFGGTTTVIDFAIPDPDESPLEGFERKREWGDDQSFVDFGLHANVTDVTDQTIDELPELIDRGAASVKLFMVYRDRLMLDDGEIHEAMETIAEHDGLALVHAENQAIIERLVEERLAADDAGYQHHPATHPEVSETVAMWTIAELVAETDCPTYFVHASAPEARDVLAHAAHRDLPLVAETCPHYLALEEEVYQRDDGEKFVCSPPVRSEETAEALWSMVEDGTIQTVNSDHCGYDSDQKRKFRDDITKMPNGLPGVETKNTVLFSEGVGKNRISVQDFVGLTSTNAAKFLGLYPQKGTIAVGSDADLVIFDPVAQWTVRADDLHMETDYTPYEGMKLQGKPTTVLSRGKVVVKDGELLGEAGHGTFVETSGEDAPERFTRR